MIYIIIKSCYNLSKDLPISIKASCNDISYLNYTHTSKIHKTFELSYPGTLFDANGQFWLKSHTHIRYTLSVNIENIEFISNIYKSLLTKLHVCRVYHKKIGELQERNK